MKIYAGDRITAHGETATVDVILNAEYFAGDVDIEFFDTNHNYRHYRNWLDGGTITRVPHRTEYRIDWAKVRGLCIKQNWYTRGRNAEYEHMLLELIPDEATGLDTVYVVAEDIWDHSDRDRLRDETGYNEDEIINMMAELIVNECSWISIQ